MEVITDVSKWILEDADNEIVKFLRVIFSQSIENRFIEIRTLSPVNQVFVPIQLGGFKYIAANFAGKKSVFFGVHPRSTTRGTSDAIASCRVFFLDLDPSVAEPVYELETVKNIFTSKGFYPAAIVSSGRGLHIYFINDYELPSEEWLNYEKQLINTFSTIVPAVIPFSIDTKASDLARILRLPNSINEKNNTQAKLLFIDETATIDIKKLIRIQTPSNASNSYHQFDFSDDNGQESNALIQPILNIVANHYREGQRQNLALYLAGFCAKKNIPIDLPLTVVKELSKDEPLREQKQRIQAVYYSYAKTPDKLAGAAGLASLGVNVNMLSNSLDTYFKTTNNFDSSTPRIAQVYKVFLSKFAPLIFKERSDMRNSLLYFFNGYYFEPFYESSQFFVNLITSIQRDLFGIIQADYAQHIYRYLLTEPKLGVIPEWQDVIAFKNKVFDLTTGTFKELGPAYGQRFVINAEVDETLFYEALERDTNSWTGSYRAIIEKTTYLKQFFETLEFDDETIAQLVECVGYALLPRKKKYNKEIVFLLTGEGANGKSTFLEIVKYLFSLDTSFVASVSLSDLEGFHLAGLLGKYINIANEITEKGDKTVAIENLKRTVSWDLMEIPLKHRDHIFSQLLLVHIFAINTLPRLNESTNAVWRRFQMINFKKIIPKEQRDPSMLSKLLTEIDAIATLFLVGAFKIATTNTINYSDISEIQVANNPIIDYLYENYVPAVNGSYIKLNELRQAVNDYLGRTKYGDLISFIPALKDAIEYLAREDPGWLKVEIVKDAIRNGKRYKMALLNILART